MNNINLLSFGLYILTFLIACGNPKCDLTQHGELTSIEVGEIKIDKQTEDVFLKLIYLGKDSVSYRFLDIVEDDFSFGNKLYHEKSQLSPNYLSSLAQSRLAIQSCEGDWRFIGDINQDIGKEVPVYPDRFMLMENRDTVVHVGKDQIVEASFSFRYGDVAFKNDKIPLQFRIVLAAKDDSLPPKLLYSNWVSSDEIKWVDSKD